MYVTPWCSMYGHWQILVASPFYRIWESAHTDSIDSNKSVFGIPLGLLLWDAQPPPKWPNNCTWDATPQLMRFKSNTSPFESRILKKHPKIHSNHNISTVFQLFGFLAVLSYPLPTLHRTEMHVFLPRSWDLILWQNHSKRKLNERDLKSDMTPITMKFRKLVIGGSLFQHVDDCWSKSEVSTKMCVCF